MSRQTAEAFYRRVGPNLSAPTEATESPWDQALQHGGPPAALLLGTLDREHGDAGRIAAARVDFLGPIPRDTGEIAAQTLRPGPAAIWTRLRIPLVDDQATTPLERLAVVADSANGISRELPFASSG